MSDVLSKGFGGDQTTVADKIAEEALIHEFKDMNCEIISEEKGKISFGEPEFRLIIDPLDGSANFIRGLYPWGISVYAETIDEKPLAGVVYDPIMKSLFYAEKGGGAFLNDNQISTVERPLSDCFITVYLHPKNNFSTITQAMGLLNPHVGRFARRSCASIELCWVVSGKLDVYLHLTPDTRIYDYPAALLILDEAGGVISDIRGNPPKRENGSLVACASKKNHQQILKILKPLSNA
jgi:myo-inositol-1(or 4)-monophosphatase